MLLESFDDDQILIMNYCGVSLNNELSSMLQKAEKEKVLLLLNVISAVMVALKETALFHGDIKPSNIVVGEDHKTIKLIDFDGSTINPEFNQEDKEFKLKNYSYTLEYAPREIIKNSPDLKTPNKIMNNKNRIIII